MIVGMAMLTVVILSATESMPRDMVRAIHHLRKGRPDGGDTLKGSILLAYWESFLIQTTANIPTLSRPSVFSTTTLTGNRCVDLMNTPVSF